MIETLYKNLSETNFKFVVNCMIGAFEKKSDDKTEISFIKIANQDENKTSKWYGTTLSNILRISNDL